MPVNPLKNISNRDSLEAAPIEENISLPTSDLRSEKKIGTLTERIKTLAERVSSMAIANISPSVLFYTIIGAGLVAYHAYDFYSAASPSEVGKCYILADGCPDAEPCYRRIPDCVEDAPNFFVKKTILYLSTIPLIIMLIRPENQIEQGL